MIDLAKLFGGTLGGTTYTLAPPEAVNATSFGTHTVSLPVQPDDYQLTYHTDSAPHGNVTTPGLPTNYPVGFDDLNQDCKNVITDYVIYEDRLPMTPQ